MGWPFLKPIVLVLQGLPASGKTSWSIAFVAKFKNWVRISKDEHRKTFKSEEKLLQFRDSFILANILKKINVVVDDTNLHPKHIERIREITKGIARVKVKRFNVGLEECIKRDLDRENKVGAAAITAMFNRYIRKK